jgi:hypothetical protein
MRPLASRRPATAGGAASRSCDARGIASDARGTSSNACSTLWNGTGQDIAYTLQTTEAGGRTDKSLLDRVGRQDAAKGAGLNDVSSFENFIDARQDGLPASFSDKPFVS